MKVHELIAELSKCNPDADVVINDEPVIDGDHNIMEGCMQIVAGIEQGWASSSYGELKNVTVWDLSFCLREIPNYTSPAVRLIGPNSESTNPDRHITINGVEQR